jgi:hypothetical protein
MSTFYLNMYIYLCHFKIKILNLTTFEAYLICWSQNTFEKLWKTTNIP